MTQLKIKQNNQKEDLGVENSPKEIRKFIGNKNVLTNICKTETYDSITCVYFCTMLSISR